MHRLSQLDHQISTSHSVSVEEQILEERAKEIQKWFNTPRFQNCQRTYTARQVAAMRGSIELDTFSHFMSKKFWKLMQECKRNKTFSLAYGALDPVQVTNSAKYLTSVYVSGWQCSSTASTTNEPGPDFADYPSSTVPNKCDQLIKMLRMQDRRQNYERSTMTENQLAQTPYIDYLTPLICDADAGFGGLTSTMKLTKLFIEAGAAGIHLEDQRAGTKKCGHMGGKVIVSTREHTQRLIAIRLQADLMKSELVIVARTDALNARLIDSNVDPIDHPYILGKVEGKEDLMTYPEAGLFCIDQQIEPARRSQVKSQWNANCHEGGYYQAMKLAKMLGFTLLFDWETPRTIEGYYMYQGSVEACARRGKEYLKIADCLWMETATPELKDAQLLSEMLDWELKNNKFLCYNLSPSFNWSKFGFDNKSLQSFCGDLAKLGYHWQFITLAGFHLNALKSEKFSQDLAERQMLAYVETIQRKEEKYKVDQLTHQRWSGADYADQLQQLISPNQELLSQNQDSTENQFDKN